MTIHAVATYGFLKGRARTGGIAQVLTGTGPAGQSHRLTSGGEAVSWMRDNGQSSIVNRQSAIGNRQPAIGNPPDARQSGFDSIDLRYLDWLTSEWIYVSATHKATGINPTVEDLLDRSLGWQQQRSELASSS
jgi:hypothetical protein